MAIAIRAIVGKLDAARLASTIAPMSQAMPIDPQKSERLTWKQICERYPDEWAVVVDMDWEDDCDVTLTTGTALVIGHFKSRKEASPFIKAAFQHYNEIGSFWTGEIRISIPCCLLPWVMGRRTGLGGDEPSDADRPAEARAPDLEADLRALSR
ncbi:MAG TPA: hypothetical protein VHW23_37640 [Kofleriaceae bacterium]|jgi:hypothetical protein|nr:hypothetical protein [Kofleriaceae bacterium]